MLDTFFSESTTKSTNNNVYSVSRIVSEIKVSLEQKYKYIIVEGEVSNFARHKASGHAYFALSDGSALLQCVCWKSVTIPELTDGMQVFCCGRVTAYAGRSQFQLNVMSITVSGRGNLMKMFEELKNKLSSEGLFDTDKKKDMPALPKYIGIITAAEGDALQDMLIRLSERVSCRVKIWSVQVQGIKAPEQIEQAIQGFNNMIDKPDVLIVARGGGSMEDLWAFNEEVTVRAIAASGIPVMTAVGHEMDVTLADHAADKRAPTPTASVEILLPTREEMHVKIDTLNQFIDKVTNERLKQHSEQIEVLTETHSHMIENFFINKSQQLDYINEKIDSQAQQQIQILRQTIPQKYPLDGLLQLYQDRLTGQMNRFNFERVLMQKKQTLESLTVLIDSCSYERVLRRGFCMAMCDGQVVSTAEQAKSAGKFEVQFSDDVVDVICDE